MNKLVTVRSVDPRGLDCCVRRLMVRAALSKLDAAETMVVGLHIKLQGGGCRPDCGSGSDESSTNKSRNRAAANAQAQFALLAQQQGCRDGLVVQWI